MDSIIIMVGRLNEGVQDIEVMPDIPAQELADALASAFGWDETYDIKFEGEVLGNYQTLAEVNAWDGSELLLVVSKRAPRVRVLQKKNISRRMNNTSAQQHEEDGDEDHNKTTLTNDNNHETVRFISQRGSSGETNPTWSPLSSDSSPSAQLPSSAGRKLNSKTSDNFDLLG